MPPIVFEALAVILVCTAASVIQRVSGFGFGIFFFLRSIMVVFFSGKVLTNAKNFSAPC